MLKFLTPNSFINYYRLSSIYYCPYNQNGTNIFALWVSNLKNLMIMEIDTIVKSVSLTMV